MYKHIFTPIKIGNVEIKNRLAVSAMVTQYCLHDGLATERYISYHEAKAKGGWGLIITENYPIEENVGSFVNLPGLWSDHQIASHKELTDRVHKYGAKICCQIYHAGRAANLELCDQTVAPSVIRDHTRNDLPRALTIEEIKDIVEKFGDAALRVKKAGFDMVELHAGHGYLINQFLSGFSNKRTDEYGGSLKNRCRILLEIVENIQKKAGEDFPIQIRISSTENIEGGLTLPQTQSICRIAEEAGVKSINASQGILASRHAIVPGYPVPRAAYVDNAAALKQVVNIPVISVGRINDPTIAETVLATGKADMVIMARASLADPELPNKIKENREDEIRYCFACVQGCIGQNNRCRDGIRCLANPELGEEYKRLFDKPARQKKKVMVAGGGIAGCEVAITAARRGHEVSLWEASGFLGGKWISASIPTGKAEFLTLSSRQIVDLKRYGVDVHLNTAVDEELIKQIAPDVLLVATGGKSIKPPILGIDSSLVVDACDVLQGRVDTGNNIVVIGGGLVGAETAEFVSQQGAKTTIIEMLPEIAKDGEPINNYYLFENLKRHDVEIHTEAICKSVNENSVTFEKDGQLHTIENVDQVILAAGVRADRTLAELGERLGVHTISVGDASKAKDGLHNIWEAFDVGVAL